MRKIFLSAVVIMAATFPAVQAEASDFELHPAVTVSEEYNDNIFGTADGRRTDFVTRVQPGMNLHYLTRLLNLDTSYIFDYRNYAKGTHGDEEIHNADVKGGLKIIDDTLILDFGDALHRTTVNAARDVATESLLVTQTNQNIAYVSPYFLWRPTEKETLKTGYRYTDTRYFEGEGTDKREHVAFADLQHQHSEKLLLNIGYTFTHADASPQGFDRHDVSAGFRYAIAERSSIFGSIGNSWSRFEANGSTSDLFWDAGVSHDFGMAVALLETRVQNIDDPQSVSTRQVSYTGRFDRVFKRGGIGISATYLEDYVTQTGSLEHRRATVTTSGRYEILPKLSASGSVYAERFKKETPDDYPYRLTGNAALSYTFYNDQSRVTLAYTVVSDRLHWDSGGGEKLTNRVLLQMGTVF